MIESRLVSVSVHSMSLVVPASDFERLPRQLGCSLHRSAHRLVLAADRPGCELVFEMDGGRARLVRLEVRDDPQGRFLRTVVAALVIAYQGDLDVTLQWIPTLAAPRVVIVQGESSHPLLAAGLLEAPSPGESADGPEHSIRRIEEWLEVGRRAWREYRALKGHGEPDHQ